MILPRIYDNLISFLKPNKVLVIYGSRQTGKTTLLKNFLSENEGNFKYKLDSGDDVNTQIVLGSSDFKKIIDYAKEEGIDLIVMGTHGRGAIEHMLIGSVAEKVVRKAP